MVLYPHPASKKFGFCDCFDARSDTKQEATFLNNRNLSHCIPEIRGQVFVPERQRCFSVFDQVYLYFSFFLFFLSRLFSISFQLFIK